MIERSEC
jgi:hypothetical protein